MNSHDLNLQSPVRNVGIRKRKQCQPMHVSGFMNVWPATSCSGLKQATAVSSAPMAMFPVLQFRKGNIAADRGNRS
ncbi:hypothetical protein MMIC_P1638 [Mariprofundus micogutta]|uniref:Uncharacterized protein n=1 Tax=Mariprofundus micogutta TaxID=1921010 RepID=A0A1L8CP17_9PROT|nr:hypothetical protein MMIC_P1638 [Mariprofundus micogutta]